MCGCEVIFGCLKSREFILNWYRFWSVTVENTAISLVKILAVVCWYIYHSRGRLKKFIALSRSSGDIDPIQYRYVWLLHILAKGSWWWMIGWKFFSTSLSTVALFTYKKCLYVPKKAITPVIILSSRIKMKSFEVMSATSIGSCSLLIFNHIRLCLIIEYLGERIMMMDDWMSICSKESNYTCNHNIQ